MRTLANTLYFFLFLLSLVALRCVCVEFCASRDGHNNTRWRVGKCVYEYIRYVHIHYVLPLKLRSMSNGFRSR